MPVDNNFYCSRCGEVNIYGQGWCVRCGTPFYYNCPQCGAYINNTCPNCPSCGMGLLWPVGQQQSASQSGHGDYGSEKGVNRVLKVSLLLVGIVIVLAAALFTINALQKPVDDTLAQSSQNAQSTQPGPSQPNGNSSSYYPPDNEFGSKPLAPADNEFDGRRYTPDNEFDGAH